MNDHDALAKIADEVIGEHHAMGNFCDCGNTATTGVEEVIADAILASDWLAKVKAEARFEGHKAGYETARVDMLSGAFVGGPTYEALRDSLTGQRIITEARYERALRIQELEALLAAARAGHTPAPSTASSHLCAAGAQGTEKPSPEALTQSANPTMLPLGATVGDRIDCRTVAERPLPPGRYVHANFVDDGECYDGCCDKWKCLDCGTRWREELPQ